MKTVSLKEKVLRQSLQQFNQVIVAFSGGIDSTLVLKAALETLGADHVLAVVANSELFTDEEFDKAMVLAQDLGAKTKAVTLDYLADEHIANNTPETWYYSKKMFYARLNALAAELGYDAVLDGMIMDDMKDFRPGLVARNEAGAKSPLQTAEFTKADVRALAQTLGLNNWNKVASCSVSSRFPYNTTLTVAKIQQVMAAEKLLRDAGFPTVRVRYHETIARIEVPAELMADLLAQKATIDTQLKALGFKFVTVDLAGFKSGRMNDSLSEAQKAALMA
ncbi:PP-loop superfamily ATP-binding protein [Agrilactobacillus composti DSM 18527 = JCM 14202]|uniref:PP-loop superfamily ATP-binding protein n=1 Tax=Agrilactobacillus composti DSM 18527 = JCM 14202 TaxID=1423734 RepID=X0PG74_9LACO|nr:ATP-dependent sacrificial sulfur transferase LarE [Agrilactobacillus composti]KRM30926.1 PP-loop superfamily ATP-binding protein [Agrilactobacillus composti DSM 18527 = JCM 14202]GAF40868.1 ATP-utilizing enzyme of the PP-loop superfamily [Agrilactobacillus composti DSM 18527 = JCM 14202]